MIFVEIILTIGFCFAIISILFSLVTIFLQLWVPRLRRFPGIIITMQCISQVFYDLHWLPVLPSLNETMKGNYSSICEIWGFFTMLFYFLGYNYATCLSFEIIFKLKNRVNSHYKTRMWIYHISAWLLAIFFCVILLAYKAYGISGLKTCSVSNTHPIHSLEYTPFILNLPIMWFSVIYAIKKLKRKYFSTTMNYALVIISVSLTWFFPTLLKLIMVLTKTEGNLALAAFLIGTLSGTCVGLSRVTNKKVQKEIKKHYKYLNIELKNLDLRKGKVESQEGFSNLLDISNSLFESEDVDFFTNFYEAISKQSILAILVSLIIKYRKEVTEKLEYSKSDRHKTIFMDFHDFEALATYYGIQKIEEIYDVETKLTTYSPSSFAKILRVLGIDPNDIYKSLLDHENLTKVKQLITMSGGNSSSILFSTADEKFVIKTISKAEKIVFHRELIRSYLKRIEENPSSKLVKILGMFKLMPLDQYFILMENIIPFSSQAYIFDLKGSSIGRYVSVSNPEHLIQGKIFKDENFKNSNKKIILSEENYYEIIKVLEDDMQILMELNIMDYSLLVCFYEPGHSVEETNIKHVLEYGRNLYAIGLIDIFQKYNKSKISERVFKKLIFRNSRELSVQPSESYYKRLTQFIREIFTHSV